MPTQAPRGIRNNNPLNIRHGNKWKGLRPVQTDKSFDQFVDMDHGLRAYYLVIYKYMMVYGLLTIRDIVTRFAPSTENDTRAYIEFVARYTGIGSSVRLHFADSSRLIHLGCAMARYECGAVVWNYLRPDDFAKAYYLVCDEKKVGTGSR